MPLRAAVLGLGSIGMRHALNLLSMGVNVVGYDPQQERIALLHANGGASANTPEAAFEMADCVIIATPSGLHDADLRAAISARKDIFIEKPLAHTTNGVADLIGEAEKNGLILFAGFNLRFHPAVIAAREALSQNRLGRILWARLIASDYLPNWRPHQDHTKGYAADPLSGGVIFDLIHEFDLARHLLGPMQCEAATAHKSGSIGIPSEDVADVLLRHNNGFVSSLHLDYVTRPPIRLTEIVGTRGQMRIDLRNRHMSIIGIDGTIEDQIRFDSVIAEDYVSEMKSFMDCVENRTTPPCSGREAFDVLQQVCRAREIAGLPTL